MNIAKAIPFSETNKELVSYKIPGIVPGSTDTAHVNVYQKDGFDGKALLEVLWGVRYYIDNLKEGNYSGRSKHLLLRP